MKNTGIEDQNQGHALFFVNFAPKKDSQELLSRGRVISPIAKRSASLIAGITDSLIVTGESF